MTGCRLAGLLFLVTTVAFPARLPANHIQVDGVCVFHNNKAAQSAHIEFALRWDHSWRHAGNRDAAWVFIKFRPAGSNDWRHASLSSLDHEHVVPGGASLDAAQDGRGVFVFRAADGSGSVEFAPVRLQWNYGEDGVAAFGFQDMVDLAVYAIEMVYIPQGAFYLGSGGNETGRFYEYSDGLDNTRPYVVFSEDALSVGTQRGLLWAANDSVGVGTLPVGYPKGFQAFYMMKHKITQGQYADFLASLSPVQAAARFPNQFGSYRHTIREDAEDGYVAEAPDRICNYFSWMDLCAYLDWAGLRPMTELEYEKAGRGPASPVADEFAWGTTEVTHIIEFDDAELDGTGEEMALPENANYSGASHAITPVRAGIFARPDGDRQRAGGGYYGVLHLNGEPRELLVSAANTEGRVFDGSHGDGVLTGSGLATRSDWPGYNAGNAGVSGATGSGYRGYHWRHSTMKLSDRSYAASGSSSRSELAGGRGVRTAP